MRSSRTALWPPPASRSRALIGAAPDEIVFTGTGSEADALAIHGTVHSQEPSPVLLAMPRHRGQALSALRLSLGRWTTQPDVERAAKAIAMTAHRLFTPTATP